MLAVALFVIDAILIVIHIIAFNLAQGFDFTLRAKFNFDADRTIPEFWGSLQIAAMVAILVYVWLKRRQPVLLAWAVVFCVLIVDDLGRLHENAGWRIAGLLDYNEIAGIDASDVGELIVYAVIGVGSLTAAAITHRISDAPARRISWICLGITFVLAFFAVVVDQVGSGLTEITNWNVPIVEDGGELLVITAGLIYLARRTITAGKPGTAGAAAPMP